jgi:hypothetical protein
MDRFTSLPRHRFAPYLMIIFTQFPILSIIYSWEPDQHHDGVMFATAVAVSQGDLPNRDTFAQYGPVTPLLQGLWLHLTSPTVLNLRLLTVIFLVAISLLMYRLLNPFVGRSLAILLNFAWVLTGPFGLPWSSVITTFFGLSLIVLLDCATYPSQNTQRQNMYLSIAGFVCAIGIFTRIHFVLIALSAMLFLKFSSRFSSTYRLNFFDRSFFVTLLSITALMSYLKMLAPYLQQCIMWAFGRYSTAPEFSKSLLIDFLWIPITAAVFIVLMFLIGFSKRSSSILLKSLPLVLAVTVSLSAVVFSRLSRTGEQTLRNPRILLIDGSQKFLYGIGYAAVTCLVILTVFFFVKQKMAWRKYPPASWIALAALAQLYPFFDPHHVWFISPILIVAVFALIHLCKFKFLESIHLGLRPFLTVVVIALFVQFGVSANQSRYDYTSPQMIGMSSVWRSADEIDRTLLALNRFAIPKSVQYDCADGLFAVGNGKYLANSPMFVTWGPTYKSPTKAKQLFGCYLDDKQIDSYIRNGYQIVFKEEWQPLTSPVDRKYWNVLFAVS